MEQKWFERILIVGAIIAVGVLIFANIAYAAPTVCQIGNGCTGTSTAPGYGYIPIGGQNGEYEFVASSTLSGGGSNSGFSTTSAAYWLTQQTTSGLAEGSNLYFTNARAIAALTGQNISLFTNNVGYLTSLAGAASSTLLTDSNTFSGVDLFTDALSNFAGTWQGFSPSHFLTGNQTITVSGAVSGSGATSITAEFASTTPVQFGGTGSTTLTGILKGNGTGPILTAVPDTDYQKPISLTTSGSSGAATFSGDTLNIPQYSGTTYTGSYPISVAGSSISIVSTSTFGCTVSCFASPNISQWTNNSGYVTSSFSTTSAAYWQSVNNFFSTTSASYFLSLNQGAAFSTTSANYWQTQTTFTGASTTLLANNNTFSGNDTFNNTISGSVSGNAGTATVLQTARTINGVSFNGSANIVVASTTLLSSDNNTFSGNTTFAASTTFQAKINAQQASTSQLTVSGPVYLTGLTTGSGNGSICGTSGGQIEYEAGANCVVGSTASSTLLGDNNTFSGIDSFTNSSSNFSGTWQTFSPSHFQTAGTYIGVLGNYASTTGASISLSTTTETTNGVTQGIDIVASANGIVFTPTISGTLSNAGLAHSTIILNSQTLTLGDTNDSITAASSTLLANNNTFSGNNIFSASTTVAAQLNAQQASTTLLTASGGVWFTGLTTGTGNGSLCMTSGGQLEYEAAADCVAGSSNVTIGNYASSTGSSFSFSTSTQTFQGATFGQNISVTAGSLTFTPNITGTLTAASSTLLANNNTWSGLNSFGAATSTSFADTALTGDLVVTGADGALENYTGTGPCAAGTFMTTLSGPGGQTCASADTFAYPWTSTSYGATTASGTSTLQGFTGGLYSTASSTINSLTSINSTSTNATSTNASFTNASTTNLVISSLATSAGTFLATNAIGQVIATTTPSGGGGAVSSVSNSDGTLTISPTTGSVVASIALAHANSWTGLQQFANSTSTLETVSSQLWAKNIETVLYADQFSGSDIGAQINNAYAALPSTGGTIFVPSGSYTFSTPINFGTQGKPAILQCASAVGGTTLTYNGSAATSTIINDFNTSNEITYGSGIRNCAFAMTASSTSGGIFLGGTNGAAGTVLDSVSVTGFGYGLVTGANTYEINVNNSTFDYNYTNLLAQPANNSGERMNFTNDGFLDSRNTHYAYCIYISTSAYASATFNSPAIDDCSVVLNDGNYDVSFVGGHAENPNYTVGGQYNFFNLATSTNNGYSQVAINDMAFVNDGTLTSNSPYNFILSGMHTSMSGDTFDSGTVTVPAAIQMLNTGQQSLEASGIENIGSAGYTTFATSSEAFVVNQPAGTWTTDLNLASNLELADTAITTTDNGDEVIGTNWGWYIKGDSTHLTQIVGGSLMVGYTVGTPGGTSYPTNDAFIAGSVGIASTTPWSALSIGSGTASSSITVAEYAYGRNGNYATSTTQNIDCNAANQIAEPIGTSAMTLTLINMTPGKKCDVVIQNPNAAASTITWKIGTGILMWSTGTAPLSSTAPTAPTTANDDSIWSFLMTSGSSTDETIGALTQ
jgi:hypothetical protein